MKSYIDENVAIEQAKIDSKINKETYYIILSKGKYYLDTSDFIRAWETLICVVENGMISMEEIQKMNIELKNYIFDDLVEIHNYWGTNSFIEMIDFCNRNNLHSQKSMLIDLMKPNRIKL